MKKNVIFFVTSTALIIIQSCAPQNKITVDLDELETRPFYKWNLEECRAVYDQFTINNARSFITSGGVVKSQDVGLYVAVTFYSPEVLKAKAREEGILKRLPEDKTKEIFSSNLEYYTNYKYDIANDSVYLNTELQEDSLKGYTFKFHFENRTDPYKMIGVKDGYEYIFLEDKKGRFSRVVEIGGLFAEQNIYISDELDVEVTFSAYDDNGEALFENDFISNGFKIVINKMLDAPIEIIWSPD